MIADLVESTVLKALSARAAANLTVELQKLEDGDAVAKAGADQAGITEHEARFARAALETWARDHAAAAAVAGGPVTLPGHAVPSLLQSAYEEFFRAQEMTAPEPSAQGLSASEVPTTTDALSADAREFILGNRDYLGGRWFTRFAERDLRFLTWGAAAKIATRLRGGKRPFTMTPAAPVTIQNRARVLMVGDWGSGVPRAIVVSELMRKKVEEAVAEQRECHVVHLGDVYYSGQSSEYDDRFLDPWPVKTHEAATIGSWCLNANHDMYSGGGAFFDHLLADKRFARQERSSFFSLENDHWQILGLDSAYDDADLHGPQVAWVTAMRERAPKKGGILLTHHQLFSGWEGESAAMMTKIRPVLDRDFVRAWFWGHEHRCAAYAPRPDLHLPYARLIGHGGVPVWAPSKPTPPGVSYEYRGSFPAFVNEEFARFGFAQLDFEGPKVIVKYFTELGGEPDRTEEMMARDA